MEVKNIPLVRIHTSPLNPRKTIDEGDLQDLSNNIKQQGLLQPITVRPIEADDTNPLGGEFEIVCGERRYRAVSMLEEDTIPCIVREMTDEEALDAMITENLQRQDVDPIEEAFAFGQLVKTGKSIEEIALRFGKSKRFIQERIKLDNLLPELKQWVTKEWMTIGAAMHVCKLTEDEQQKFFEYMEDTAVQENDPITKQDAIDYTDDLFMNISKADWHRDFKGSCGTTCVECPFNSANVGCLFYEKAHDATCTNRERWNAKHYSWLCQRIDDNADVLVKDGDNLEAGKSVIVDEPGYFVEDCAEYEPLLDYIRGKGFKIVNKEDYFERYSSYREEDDRLKEKLANNEVYRAVVVEAKWKGVDVCIRYYEFKKTGTEHSSDEVQAMQLVNEYKENERKNSTNIASKLRSVLADMEPTELPTEPLSQTESLILLTLILRKAYKFRNGIDLTSTYSSEPKVLNYARAHTEQVHQICRDFIRQELSSAGVEYDTDLQDCQYMLLQEWAKEQADEVKTKMAAKLAKKQAVIEEQLNALGYNTDGTKMES